MTYDLKEQDTTDDPIWGEDREELAEETIRPGTGLCPHCGGIILWEPSSCHFHEAQD